MRIKRFGIAEPELTETVFLPRSYRNVEKKTPEEQSDLLFESI